MEKQFKILLATDYSDSVMNAERYAVQLARSLSASLTFLHVYQFPISAAPTRVLDYAKVRSDFEQSELKCLEHHRQNIFHTLGMRMDALQTECVVREGKVGREVRLEARDAEMDFVIVGTHGTSRLRKMFYGTHAWDVMRRSSVPVLAVPKEALFTDIRRIVFATEYREGELPVINYITQLAARFHADVTVLHVTNFVLSKKFEDEMFRKFHDEVISRNTYSRLDFRVAHYEDIATGLDDFCQRCEANWLVMSPEKSNLIDLLLPKVSMTRKMSFQTHIPLLSIPDFYNTEHASFWKMFELDEQYWAEE